MRPLARAMEVLIAHDIHGPTPAFTTTICASRSRSRDRAAIAVDLSEQVSRDAVRRVVEAQELERARG